MKEITITRLVNSKGSYFKCNPKNRVRKRLRSIKPTGYSDEFIYVSLARGLTRSEQNLDQDEIINVVEYPLDQALQMIAEGRITDALTILALQWAWFSLKGRN